MMAPADFRWQTFVRVFLERFVLAVLAAVLIAIVFANPMAWDLYQRVGAGIAVVGLAIFVGATVERGQGKPPSNPIAAGKDAFQMSEEKPNIRQKSTGPNSPNVVGDNNTFNFAAEPRAIPAAVWRDAAEFLAKSPGIVEVGCMANDVESTRLADQIEQLLRAAGWKVETGAANMMANPIVGVQIAIHGEPITTSGMSISVHNPPLASIASVLQSMFQSVEVVRRNEQPEGRINILVGLRPDGSARP